MRAGELAPFRCSEETIGGERGSPVTPDSESRSSKTSADMAFVGLLTRGRKVAAPFARAWRVNFASRLRFGGGEPYPCRSRLVKNKDAEPETEVVSFLIEHGRGVVELWLRREDLADLSTAIPLHIESLSGGGTALITRATIGNAMLLERWMQEHPELLSEGRTVTEA